MTHLGDLMNQPGWCFRCRRITQTTEWDCVLCSVSKGYPEVGVDQQWCNRCGKLSSKDQGCCPDGPHASKKIVQYKPSPKIKLRWGKTVSSTGKLHYYLNNKTNLCGLGSRVTSSVELRVMFVEYEPAKEKCCRRCLCMMDARYIKHHQQEGNQDG